MRYCEMHDGRWRKVRMKLVIPKGLPQLSAYAKTGYYAPSQQGEANRGMDYSAVLAAGDVQRDDGSAGFRHRR